MPFAVPFFISILVLVSSSLALFFLIRKRSHSSHPLPPGPRALPVIGHLHLLGPLIHQSFQKLSSLYGPIIYLKFGDVPCVVASTPELAKELLRTHELSFHARGNTATVDRMTYDSSFSFSPNGPYWKLIKKISMSELLGPRIIKDFLPIREKEYDQFLRVLKSRAMDSQIVNLSEELVKLSNNIISQMMFSFRSSDTEGQSDEARHLIREVTQMFGEFNVSDFIRLFKNIDVQGSRKRVEEVHMRYDALLEKVIGEREEQRLMRRKMSKTNVGEQNKVKDFLDTLLDAMENKNSEVKITRLQIKGLILDLFTGGTDTTATSTEWALAELINNPEILQNARKEIDAVVGKGRLVEEKDIPNLPYLQAIVKETFRLHPPVPMIARKAVESCIVNGYSIPEGSLLFVNMWAIGRDPKNWENPSEFRPSRFLDAPLLPGDKNEAGGQIDIKGHHYQILPFGTGRRGCPGINLALQEVPTMLASLIHCFEWGVTDGDKEKINGGCDGGKVLLVDMTERAGLTVPRADDLVLVPRARFDLNSVI